MYTTARSSITIAAFCALTLVACDREESATGEAEVEAPTSDQWSCTYVNRFSSTRECKNFVGSGWTEDNASADCEAQQDSLFEEKACDSANTLGTCDLEHRRR